MMLFVTTPTSAIAVRPEAITRAMLYLDDAGVAKLAISLAGDGEIERIYAYSDMTPAGQEWVQQTLPDQLARLIENRVQGMDR